MAALGAPIIHDDMYPSLRRRDAADHSAPLQLLAKRLIFVDPVTGTKRDFSSRFTLSVSTT